MTRPSKYDYFMQMSYAAAARSTCSRLSVGCVFVREEIMFVTGYNGKARGEKHCEHDNSEASCVGAVHAEVNAIASAARLGLRVQGSQAYVTHAPCLSCARALINTGLHAVYFDQPYRSTEGANLLRRHGLNHQF